MLLETYTKSFENSWNLLTGYKTQDVSFKNNDYSVSETTDGYTYVTGYKEPVDDSVYPEQKYVTGLSYKFKELDIAAEFTSYYDTRDMYALLKITGAGDDTNSNFEFSTIITGKR